MDITFSKKMKTISIAFSYFSRETSEAYENELVRKKYDKWLTGKESENILTYADRDFKWIINLKEEEVQDNNSGLSKSMFTIAVSLADEMDEKVLNDNN
jgi:hypothetical protein